MVRLRAFEPADLPAAHQLDQLCFPPSIVYSLAELRRFIRRKSALALVAEQVTGSAPLTGSRTHMAGFLVADFASHYSSAATIVTIDVAPEKRRSGIASLLMDAAEVHCAGLACTVLSLEVAVDNLGAQAFYARRGFKVAGRVPGYYNGVLDAFTLRKELQPILRDR